MPFVRHDRTVNGETPSRWLTSSSVSGGSVRVSGFAVDGVNASTALVRRLIAAISAGTSSTLNRMSFMRVLPLFDALIGGENHGANLFASVGVGLWPEQGERFTLWPVGPRGEGDVRGRAVPLRPIPQREPDQAQTGQRPSGEPQFRVGQFAGSRVSA